MDKVTPPVESEIKVAARELIRVSRELMKSSQEPVKGGRALKKNRQDKPRRKAYGNPK